MREQHNVDGVSHYEVAIEVFAIDRSAAWG